MHSIHQYRSNLIIIIVLLLTFIITVLTVYCREHQYQQCDNITVHNTL